MRKTIHDSNDRDISKSKSNTESPGSWSIIRDYSCLHRSRQECTVSSFSRLLNCFHHKNIQKNTYCVMPCSEQQPAFLVKIWKIWNRLNQRDKRILLNKLWMTKYWVTYWYGWENDSDKSKTKIQNVCYETTDNETVSSFHIFLDAVNTLQTLKPFAKIVAFSLYDIFDSYLREKNILAL